MKLPSPPAMPDPPNWVDVADLHVQQQLADIAQQMLTLTYWQIAIGIAGTLGLLFTLWESRRATAVAMKALHVQQSAERAVLVVQAVKPFLSEPTRMLPPMFKAYSTNSSNDVIVKAKMSFKNQGRSMGFVTHAALEILVGAEPKEPKFSRSSKRNNHRPIDVDGTYEIETEELIVPDHDYELLRAGEISVWFFGYVDYDDVFGAHHRFSYAYEVPKGEGRLIREFGGENFWLSC